ncbi:MAG: hypothetical protein J6V66_04350 [Clostridia bacterium]|nr:hypothetical protein [Clostridia bacterium]
MADKETRFRSESLSILQDEIKAEHDQMQKERLAREKEQSKIDFSEKQNQLLNQLISLEQEYGSDYYLVELLSSFYEVSVEMENVMKSMESVNMAMECVSEALNFLDASVQFDQKLMEQSNQQSYSLRSRIKLKRQMRKTRKNNIGRMKAMVNGLTFKYRMMEDMVESLKKFAGTMSANFKKVNKKKKSNVPSAAPSEAQRRIAQRRAELNANSTPAAASAPSAGSAGKYDDLL